jgi:hypothetical protein
MRDPASREPIAACPGTARTIPCGEATSIIPCWCVTTMPWNGEAANAWPGGRIAATHTAHPAARFFRSIGALLWISLRGCSLHRRVAVSGLPIASLRGVKSAHKRPPAIQVSVRCNPRSDPATPMGVRTTTKRTTMAKISRQRERRNRSKRNVGGRCGGCVDAESASDKPVASFGDLRSSPACGKCAVRHPSVQAQHRQHGAVDARVQEVVHVPARPLRRRPRGCRDVGAVGLCGECVRERVTELAAVVDRAASPTRLP